MSENIILQNGHPASLPEYPPELVQDVMQIRKSTRDLRISAITVIVIGAIFILLGLGHLRTESMDFVLVAFGAVLILVGIYQIKKQSHAGQYAGALLLLCVAIWNIWSVFGGQSDGDEFWLYVSAAQIVLAAYVAHQARKTGLIERKLATASEADQVGIREQIARYDHNDPLPDAVLVSIKGCKQKWHAIPGAEYFGFICPKWGRYHIVPRHVLVEAVMRCQVDGRVVKMNAKLWKGQMPAKFSAAEFEKLRHFLGLAQPQYHSGAPS